MPRKRAITTSRIRVDGRMPMDNPAIKSAERVLTILEFFDDIQTRATVMDIADTLKLPQSSTSALLRSLTTLGYLDYAPHTRTYIPTARVSMLGSWINTKFVVGGKIIELMQELNDLTGHTVMLVTRNGQYTQFIHVVNAREQTRPYLSVGTSRSIFHAGTGYALLSAMPDNEIRRLIVRYNAETRDPQQHVDSKEMLTIVQKVREDGYAVRDSTCYGASIAMPLFGVMDQPLAIGLGSSVAEEIHGNCARLVEMMRAAIERHSCSSDMGKSPFESAAHAGLLSPGPNRIRSTQ